MRRSTGPLNNTLTLYMIGYYATGKTSILTRLHSHSFHPDYHMTLNPTSSTILLARPPTLSTKIQLIDSLGNSLSKLTVEGRLPTCHALLLVYDITNEQSFYRLDKWLLEVRHLINQSVLLVLVGTHLDQPYKRKVDQIEARKWKNSHGVHLFFQISNKTNQNVQQMFQQIARTLVYQQKPPQTTSTLNPQDSNPWQQRNPRTNSKITILEKKLQFKQQQCDKLWVDLQGALQKISELQGGLNQRSEKMDMLSSMMETDSDQMEGKIRLLQENIKVLEEFYTSRQDQLEESSCKKFKELNNNNQQLKTQLSDLQAKYHLQLTVVNNLEQTIKQKNIQYNNVVEELDQLMVTVDETLSLLDIDQNTSNCTSKVANLHLKFMFISNCLSEKQNSLMHKSYEFKMLEQTLEQQTSLNQDIGQKLKEVKKFLEQQKYEYQTTLTNLKTETVLRIQLQGQLFQIHNKVRQMQLDFQLKSQELIERIEEKEKIIRILLQDNQYKYDRLQILTIEKDKLLQIIEKKEEVVSRAIDEKIKQIDQLKEYISNKNSTSTKFIKQYSANLSPQVYSQEQTEEQYNNKIIIFFNHFIDKTKYKSQKMLMNLTNIFSTFQQMCKSFQEIRLNTESLDISQFISKADDNPFWDRKNKINGLRGLIRSSFEKDPSEGTQLLECEVEGVLDDVQSWETKKWHRFENQSNRRVSQVMTLLCDLQANCEETTSSFRESLQQIRLNLKQVEELSEIGVEDYIYQQFN